MKPIDPIKNMKILPVIILLGSILLNACSGLNSSLDRPPQRLPLPAVPFRQQPK